MINTRPSKTKDTNTLPLQGLQRTICMFEQFNSGTTIYHEAYKVELKGALDTGRLQLALEKMIAKHPALRSRFIQDANKSVVQEFLPTNEALKKQPFKIIDTSKYDESAFFSMPFALEQAPLWRAVLVKKDKDHFEFSVVFHHLIYDGFSNEVFKRDLASFYNDPNLAPIEVSVAPAIQTDEYLSENIPFWEETLKDSTPLEVKSDLNTEQKFCFRGSRANIDIDEQTVTRLKQISDQTGASTNTLLLTCFYIWLHRVTGEKDICIGTASANRRRNHIDMKDMFNCFFNSVPLRLFITDKNFDELAQEVRSLAKNAYTHQIPLDIINKKLTNRVNTFFILHPARSRLTLNGVKSSEPIDIDLQHSRFVNFGVNLYESENGKTFRGFVEFNRDKFSQEFIARFINHFQNIINTIIKNPQAKISEIAFLSAAEKDSISRLNDTSKENKMHDFVHQLFSKHANEVPQANAFVFHAQPGKKVSVTYQQAEHYSSALAAHLYKNNVHPNTRVGICLSRSPKLMISILATLKTGGVVVPLETNPNEWRVIFRKLNQSKTQLIIVDNNSKDLFSEYTGQELTLINLDEPFYTNHTFPLPHLLPEHIAYIMFTSGTTGDREGVQISHRNLLNAINAIIDRNYPKQSKVLCTAPFTFDCSFFEWLEALVTQGEAHYIEGMEQFNPKTITRIMNQEQLNLATLTPNIIEKLKRSELPPSLCDLISMGDYPRKETIQAFQGIIRNEYGLTQAGIFSTSNVCQSEDPHTCIGLPIRNTKIFILDQYQYICPPSVSGKIYISSESLGCYLDEKLTQKEYVVYQFNPIQFCFTKPNNSANESKAHERVLLYDTNDLGTYLPTKNGYKIDFKGRSGRRIKLHSTLQVNLGEIESALLYADEIKEVAVTYDKNNGLTAYFVPVAKNKIFSTRDLNLQLRKSPILSAIRLQHSLQVESIPLNSSGKINYKELAELKLPAEPIVQPTTELQKILRKIWAEALSIPEDKISMDHFYNELGGHSRTVPTIVVAINKTQLLREDITKLSTIFPSFELDISILEQEKLLIPLLKSYRLTCVHSPKHFKTPPINTVLLHKENSTPKSRVS